MRRHITKGLSTKFGGRAHGVVACPFYPLVPGTVRVALQEIVLEGGEYKPTGVTLSVGVSGQAYDILAGEAVVEVGVPDAAYDRRRWVLISE